MSKNQKTYLLLVAVVIVWGAIGFQIYSYMGPEDYKPVIISATKYTPPKGEKTTEYTIQPDYRDPFLGKIYRKETHKKKVKKIPKPAVIFPKISYNGIIKGAKSAYIITIGGTQEIFQLKQTIKGITLIRANENEVVLKYQKETKKISHYTVIGFTKIKAGAIQYVLVVSIIIMIVLFAFISLVYLQNRIKIKSEVYKTAIDNSYLAIDYLSEKEIPYERKKEFRFTDFEGENTTLIKKRWGIFDIAIATSKINNERFEKIAILGNKTENRKALYLQDNNQPLKIVGNTQIIGDALLPKRGISPGNIAGKSYYGEKLIYGNVKVSSSKLPIIRNLDYIRNLTKEVLLENYKSFNLEEEIEVQRSFNKETLLFETSNDLVLANMKLQGNIVLVSTSKVRVFPTASLENVILIAPEVIIESGFEGSLQVFSTKKIEVKNKAKLNYPSGLTVIEDDLNQDEKNEKIIIRNGADVRGVILYHNKDKKSDYNTQVLIEKNSKVKGEVFCNKNLELQGTVEGYVYTNSFIARQFGGVYINHIYNGKIDSKAIPEQYTGLFIGETNPTVAKWID